MQVIIKGKNLDITPAMRRYTEKKVSKLGKFFDDNLEIVIEVAFDVQRSQEMVEITAHVNGLLLRAEGRTDDMYASVDAAVDKLERQVRKYKTRLQKRFHSGPKLSEVVAEEEANQEDDAGDFPKVVKTKRFAIKPMEVEEAVMQMELLGHDFFVYRNADTNEVNVLYRRKDGNLGLIEPEF